MGGKQTHVNAQDGKKSITVSQQTTDAPVLPVAQLETLHGFRPDLVDWVVQETSNEAANRRKESHRVNTLVFIERLLGQIFSFGIGIVGVGGGVYAAVNGAPEAGGVIATVSIGTLAVAFISSSKAKR